MTTDEAQTEPVMILPARRVIALALFDAAAVAYQLPHEQRHLLHLAALFYDRARQAGEERVARRGRDLVLVQPLDGMDMETQCIVASTVAFQGDRLRREQELAFLRLDHDDQRTALRLGAILALADALAANNALVAIYPPAGDERAELTVVVGGERASLAVEAASERDWRWIETIGPLTIRSAAPDEVIAPLAVDDDEPVAIAEPPIVVPGEEDFAESARRSLRRHFEKMLAREADVRGGEDPEDVHQMRVATRRLRASLQVAAPVFDADIIRKFRRKLRSAAATLGEVRDADVFLDHLRAYRDTLPAARKSSLDQLIGKVEAERASARGALLEALDTKRYQRFKHDFARFLTTPHAGVVAQAEHGGPLRVRDLAGSLVWHRYEDLRSFEAVLPNAPDETLHQMRIAGKRLRYTLEFFADALGKGVDNCLDPLAELQEALGSLQDSVVARQRIERLGMQDTPGARAYLARREAERTRYLRQFPTRWAKVNRPAYRRHLFELFGTL